MMPAPLRCLVVDDEPPARDELAYLLSCLDNVEIVALASTARAALQAIAEHAPDLVFLDIHLPGQDGFFVTGELCAMPNPPLVVMATAYDDYAIRAFDENAIDYVLKPFTEDRIAKSVERARSLLQRKGPGAGKDAVDRLLAALSLGRSQSCKRIPVEHSGRLLLLDPEEILYCRAENKRVYVHTYKEFFPAQAGSTLESLGERLSPELFFRCHRAFLVNLAHVQAVTSWENGRYLLTIKNPEQTEIPVSKANARELKARIGL